VFLAIKRLPRRVGISFLYSAPLLLLWACYVIEARLSTDHRDLCAHIVALLTPPDDTVAALDPEAGFRKGFLRPLQRKGELAALWKANGLGSVEEAALTIWMEFRDFADYWTAFAWVTDDYLQGLSESASMRVTERVRAAYLAGAADGPRAFTATAWAVRGVRC